ncbi:acyl-CoA dehydrogenase family protein [Parvularcula oceani]|uniref:acyl-CoA dehydrogenase family protein n=1 Tax=Parvularcula oceani TaxID=1247963 RepID=UPI0004E15733|nr:acyl-CoA dehydrogenase family protein [Parvularcula oceani]
MALVLDEEQEMLRDSARGFISEKSPVSALRRLRDEDDPDRFDRKLWAEMAEMGFAGILVPEEHGGSGFGFVGAGVVAEEMGRTLTASPYLSTSVMAATALSRFGTDEQKGEHLPKIAGGEAFFALAVDEGRKHAPAKTAMEAARSGNGFKLSGRKTFVADGGFADQILVAARTGGSAGEKDGVTLFVVDAKAKGLSRETMRTVDERAYARLDFDGVEVDGSAVLGEVDGGFAALETVLNAGRAGLAAEMTGAADAVFHTTNEYLKERSQFGAPIGSFQALQHRAAHLLTEIEMAKAVTLQALQALDGEIETAGATVSLAKAKVGQVAKLASQEAVQMHGGIGMTDEYDIGFYMKRIRVAQEWLGDPDFHNGRLAEILGY